MGAEYINANPIIKRSSQITAIISHTHIHTRKLHIPKKTSKTRTYIVNTRHEKTHNTQHTQDTGTVSDPQTHAAQTTT